MKRIAAIFLCACLLSTAQFTAMAENAPQNSEVFISATVPDSHTLTVKGDNKKVFYQGKSGESFSLDRLSTPKILIKPDSGYKVVKVLLNGEGITSKLSGGYYTFSSVYEDMTLEVTTQAVDNTSDSTHDISGSLKDEEGNPISGVTVEIGDESAVTDENGDFTITGISDGFYPVTVTDEEGNVIGYTEIEIVKGETALKAEDDGSFKVYAPRNGNFSFALVLSADGKINVSDVKAVADSVKPQEPDENEQQEGGKTPATGVYKSVPLWICGFAAFSALAVCTLIYLGSKKHRKI